MLQDTPASPREGTCARALCQSSCPPSSSVFSFDSHHHFAHPALSAHQTFFTPHSAACTDTFQHPPHTCRAKGVLKIRMQSLRPPTRQKTTSCLVTRSANRNQSHAETATLQRCFRERLGNGITGGSQAARLARSHPLGTWSSCPTGFWRSWCSKTSLGPGKATTAPGGAPHQGSECDPRVSAEQGPHPFLDCCVPPVVGAWTTALQPAPALTERSELALNLSWRNKALTCSKNSSMKRSRSTLTVTSSSSSLSFACNKTERGINKGFLQSLQLHFRSSSTASYPSPLLTCSQELGSPGCCHTRAPWPPRELRTASSSNKDTTHNAPAASHHCAHLPW